VTARKPAPHPPVVDPCVPVDQAGRAYCTCGIAIVDGDPRHTLPVVPEQAEHHHRYEHEEET
jgi:hypothetical protein